MTASAIFRVKGEIGMENNQVEASLKAADKLLCEIEKAKKCFTTKGTQLTKVKHAMVEPVGKMLIKFCYQNDEFAMAVERCDIELHQVIEKVMENITRESPSISDAEAYALAVKCYLPAAEVSVSIRVILPEERDEDLLFLNPEISAASEGDTRAMILDLFDTGEV